VVLYPMSSATDFPTKEELKGAVIGTFVYIALYYGFFIPFQSFSKFFLYYKKKREAKEKDSKEKLSFRAVKYYNSRDMMALTGDRTVGNFGEFAIIFLPMFWIHAVFVDHTQSLTIALIYTASRAIYPICFQDARLIFFSTVPGYLVLTYLCFQVGWNVVLA